MFNRWPKQITQAGLRPESRGLWSGVVRGRALLLTLRGNDVVLKSKILNTAHLVDELSSRSPVPITPWLSELASLELTAFVQAPQVSERWHVKVRGTELELACAAVRPEQLRFLLDLACDLAESVDDFGEALTRYNRRS